MKKQTVLITGASRGIGQGIARYFAKNGFQTIITCKQSKEALFALKNEIQTLYQTPCYAFVGDMGDFNTVKLLFQEIQIPFGGVDILINNCAISHIGLLSDMTIDQWNDVLQSNLSSAFLCSKHSIPYMVRQKQGKIINISSIWGICGASCEVAYSASKGGLNAFTKALAKELAPSNIQVNAIACGVIDTQMNACFDKEERSSLMEEIPTGRFGTPAEVATFAYQLATGNDYLTGQIIGFDGGWN